MNRTLRLIRDGTWIIGTGVLALLVHLAAILLVPTLVPVDAYTRLGRFEVQRGFHVLPAAGPETAALRAVDPAIVTAICRYDLDEGEGLRVFGRAAISYWGLSLHTRTGLVYYAINNRAVGERPFDLRVLTRDGLTRLRADLPEAAEDSLLIPAPEPQGFVMVRALVTTPNARPRVEQELGNLRCEVIE